MRRSSSVRLTILAGASLSLAACGDGQPPPGSGDTFVATRAACTEIFGQDASESCRSAFRQAEEQHIRSAPRFASMEQCRTETGSACQTAGWPGVGEWVIPVMGGVLLGRAISGDGGMRGVLPVYGGRPPTQCPEGMVPDQNNDCAQQRAGHTSGGYRHYWSGGTYVGGGSYAPGAPHAPVNLSRGGSGSLAQSLSGASGRSGSVSVPARSVSRGGLGSTGRGFSSGS